MTRNLSVWNSLRPFSVGFDSIFDEFDRMLESTERYNTNYPPYNLVQVNNTESRLEIALAGFKKEEVNVYTEYGKLFVEGKKKDDLQSVMKLIEDAKIGIPVQFVNFSRLKNRFHGN